MVFNADLTVPNFSIARLRRGKKTTKNEREKKKKSAAVGAKNCASMAAHLDPYTMKCLQQNFTSDPLSQEQLEVRVISF